MSYDGHLADRVRCRLPEGTEERPMFGGVGFMTSGHLCVAVMGDGLLVRVGKEAGAGMARLPHAQTMKMGKRTMSGWVFVEPPGLAADDDLSGWIRRGLEYVSTLQPK